MGGVLATQIANPYTLYSLNIILQYSPVFWFIMDPVGLFQHLLSVRGVAFATVAILLINLVARKLRVSLKQRAFKAQNGVAEPVWLPQKYYLRGFDTGWDQVKAQKNRRLLEIINDRFNIVGRETFKLRLMNRVFAVTMDPENLKTILVTQQKNWHFNMQRKIGFELLLGTGKC